MPTMRRLLKILLPVLTFMAGGMFATAYHFAPSWVLASAGVVFVVTQVAVETFLIRSPLNDQQFSLVSGMVVVSATCLMLVLSCLTTTARLSH